MVEGMTMTTTSTQALNGLATKKCWQNCNWYYNTMPWRRLNLRADDGITAVSP